MNSLDVADQFTYTARLDLTGSLRSGVNRLSINLAYLQVSSSSSPEGRNIYGYGSFKVADKNGIFFQDQFTPWRAESLSVFDAVGCNAFEAKASFWQWKDFSVSFLWQPELVPPI